MRIQKSGFLVDILGETRFICLSLNCLSHYQYNSIIVLQSQDTPHSPVFRTGN
jgi:hypothetical protein